jgi:hypothetical protein
MSVKRVIVGAAVLAAVTAVSAAAQEADQTPGQRAQQVQARFQIAAMEGVLERAVLLGAQKVRVRVQAIAPDLLFVNGTARARGFWLDGYGVFFDVDVPPMRRSLIWTTRVLDQGDRNDDSALQDFKRSASGISDPVTRRQVLDALAQFERQRAPADAAAPSAPGTTRVKTADVPVRTATAPTGSEMLEDPGQIYTYEVKDALVNAMIDYGTPIPLAPGDYLTVAARDQEGMHLQASDPYEVSTIFLRVKGADLAAYRAGQIDLAEVRRRVEIREY